jgi:hypothetical protein
MTMMPALVCLVLLAAPGADAVEPEPVGLALPAPEPAAPPGLSLEVEALKAETAALRAEVRKVRAALKKEAQRRADGDRRLDLRTAKTIDVPTVQLGVVLTSFGGSFALGAVLSGATAFGLFALGGVAQQEGAATTALLTGAGALLQGLLAAGLLYFGATKLKEGLDARPPGRVPVR